jgi:hypothetical protein
LHRAFAKARHEALHSGAPEDGGNMKTLRDQGNPQAFYRDDHLFVDLRRQVVMVDSQTVTLTRVEYAY